MKKLLTRYSGSKSILFLFFYLIGTVAFGQNAGNISGKIKEVNGNPINGASIQIRGTSKGTTSNAEGAFSITGVKNGKYTLEITSLGFEKQEVNVVVSGGTSPGVEITMKAESKSLGEVVIVAYGTSTKKTSTGAIQTIDTKELQDLPVAQFTQKLQGKLAGVQITQNTGKPGQGMSVRIRGQASILAGSDPLYVVDGFPITGDISNINPDEIESISVLKDAAATSLYGSRAANGVVIINTIHAKSGQSNLGVNAYYGYQTVPQKGRPDMMNATEFAQFKNESYQDLGLPVPSQFQNPSEYGAGYNWYDAMLQTAPIQNYSVSFSSNRDKFNTSIIAGYFNQDGVLRNSNYQRYSLRANTEIKVTEKINAGFNVAPSYSINNTPGSDGAFYATNINQSIPGGLLYNGLLTWPILPYKNADGSLPLTAWIPGISAFPTPNWYRALQEIKNTTKTTRVLANAYIEYQPISGLNLKSTINIDMGNSLFDNFNPSTVSTTFASLPPVIASSMRNNSNYYSWLNENTATYKKSFNDHNFNLLAGYTTQKFRSDMSQLRLTNFPDDRISTIQSAVNIDRTRSSSDIQEWSLISFIGRLDYNYKEKYLFTAALRRDGSSRFGTNNQWGNFPSVSVGWLVSDESFMNNIKAISFLKIRGSYGVLGNNNIGNYTQYATVDNTTSTVFGGSVASGASVTTLGNADLGWETTKEFDLGLDLSLFNSRINFTYDYYTKRTTNLLYNLAVPQESGFSNYTGNIGELKFWGSEFALNTKNMVDAFKWNTTFNISFSDNRVMSLSNGVNYIFGPGGRTLTEVGHRIGQFWGMIQEGVYKDQADFDKSPKALASEVGTAKFKDVNGDGKVRNGGAPGTDDRTFLGNPFPKFIYGITNNFSYKNFDLSIVGSGSVGNDVAVMTDQGTTNLDGVFNVLKDVKYRWRSPSNPGAGKYGKTTSGTGNERDWMTSRFISKASFFTIKNIALGYNLPIKKDILFKSVRLYASVQQAFVFTKYRGANPEVSTNANGTSADVLSLGQDWGTYPIPRTVTFGANFSLK